MHIQTMDIKKVFHSEAPQKLIQVSFLDSDKTKDSGE